ncbi:DUF6965 family protein [Sphingobacterium deserti]|uniref:DUF6965 family protein n=1 Tax=Sphingobacterium deserti TaxID=1229276 RepID=UPI00056901D8
MTIPELKEFFEGKTFTPPIQISEDQTVEDPVIFLKTQFIMVGQWPEKKPLDRCPAYLRLMKFHRAIS